MPALPAALSDLHVKIGATTAAGSVLSSLWSMHLMLVLSLAAGLANPGEDENLSDIAMAFEMHNMQLDEIINAVQTLKAANSAVVAELARLERETTE